MKLRQLKHRHLEAMVHRQWDLDNPKMWHTRHLKPCKSYSYGCSDCNAVLFRKLMGRFPHTFLEFCDFESYRTATATDLEVPWSEVLA